MESWLNMSLNKLDISSETISAANILTTAQHPQPLFTLVLIKQPERQSARMSKITHDCLTWSGTGCFIAAVSIWQQWASKG